MQKDTIIGVSVLVVIILAVVGYAALRPAPAAAPDQTASSTPMVDLPQGAYVEHAAYYDIEAYYATSTPLAGSSSAAAVTQMREFVSDTILQFKADGNFDHLTPADITTMGFDKGRKESLKIVYLQASSPHTVSYVFTTYTDTLGAHGNSDFTTFTYDTSTGKALSLGDIFLPGSNYLATLSQLAHARLPSIIGDNYDVATIADGTTPTEEHFKNFFFDNGDFVILFPPYQVAAYSEGPQTLRLPLSLLASVLKSQYR